MNLRRHLHLNVDLRDADTGEVWTPSGAAAITEITSIPTAETDDTLVLAPDGAGGVSWEPVPTELPAIGSGGSVLTVVGNAPSWEASLGTINFIIDGGGSAIASGVRGDVIIDTAGTLMSWSLLANQSGSIVVDVWKDTYANFPPTNADAMPGSGKELAINSGVQAQDLSITDWTTNTFSAGDVIRFNVDSATNVQRVTLSMKYKRS